MTLWFHSTILATSLAATVAIGIASASLYSDNGTGAKADKLPLAASSETTYLTLEARAEGVSTLSRVPLLN
jgi:hypothetical protein